MRTIREKPRESLRPRHRRSLALALTALALCLFAPHEADGQWFLFGRAQKRYDRCIELYTSNQFDESRMCIRTFLSEYPNSRWVEQLQFLEAKLETNVYEAQAKMRRFLQEFPDGPYSAEANFSLGELYELTADYPSAQKCYLQVYRYFLTSELREEAGVRAAKCMLLDGDTMSAKEYLQDYLAADPSPPWRSRARELYADTLLESGEFATAQKMYKEIISEASSPEEASPDCYIKIAGIYESKGNYKSALQAYRQFLNIFPDSIHKPAVERKIADLASLLKVDLSINGRPHIIEAGLFVSEQKARRLVGRLNKLGHQAYLVTRNMNGTEYLSVRLGPYESRDSALAVVDRLGEEAGLEVKLLPQGGPF
jgi:TolA-binding protein